MKNKVLKTAIVIVLIIALTIADFVLVGTNLVTYALENINNSTDNENIKFSVYFKTEEGEETSKINYEMTNAEMKLYLDIAVEDGVSFDGVITLGEDSNFKFKKNLSKGISKIEGNAITLEQIKKGNTAKIEVGIEPVIEESYGDNLLSKESVLKLKGNYKDSTEKNINIEAEKKVNLSLIVPSNLDSTLEGKVITNRIYKIGEENKRLVQIELNSRVVDNVYPINNTEFDLQLPNGVEELEVITKGTYATDGKDDRKLQENNDYIWNRTSNLLQVKLENVSKDGKISWKQDAIDNIIVTLILPEDIEIATEEYNVKSIIQIYGQEKTLEKELKYNLSQAADGIIRASIDNKETIYKGKLYSKEEREYKSITNIEVNYANLIENASVKESVAYRIEENSENKAANIIYKSTTISKSEFEKILGAEGSLIIKDQKEDTVKEVKSTDFDENGNLTINYAKGVQSLTIEVTKPIETGVIRLNHTKAIKEEGQYSETEIDAIKYFVEQVEVSYSTAKYTFERKKTLRETTSEVGITVTAQSISSERKNEVPIAITLKTDNEKYKLFENPTFTLTMPEGVTINSVSDGTESQLFGGLSISKLEAISSREIRIELSGVQTEYIESNINSQINFTANLSVEKLMPNKVDTIKMQYENKGSKYNMESEPINVIASNSKVVTHLKLENYNGFGTTIEKYSDVAAEVSGKLPLNNETIINVPIKYTIINNYASSISLLEAITANYIDKDGNAIDLINYVGQDDTIEPNAMRVIEKEIEIPADLYYSEKVDIKTSTKYTYSGTEYSVNNDIKLETETKQGIRNITMVDNKVQLETFAQLGDGTGIKEGDEVYNEQIVKYIIQVTNVSNNPISNLVVMNNQQNGNIYDLEEIEVTNIEIQEGTFIEHRYAELDTNIKAFEIETLKPGESRELLCKIVAKKSEQNNITAANISVKADEIEEYNIEKISNVVRDAELKIASRRALNEEVQMYGDSSYLILTDIKNLTGKELKEINIRIHLSEGLMYKENYPIKALDENEQELNIVKDIKYNQEENYIDLKIKSLTANQEILLTSMLYIEKIDLKATSKNVTVYLEANNIISNDVTYNIKQLETKVTVTQSVNIDESEKVKDKEKVIITGKISNIGSIDSSITITDKLPKGLEANRVTIIKNGERIDKTSEVVNNNILIAIDLNKDETVYIEIETIVNTSRILTDTVENTILVKPLMSEEVASNTITIAIESTIDTSTGENSDYEKPEDPIPEEPIPEEPDPVEPGPVEPGPDNPKPEEPKDPENPTPEESKYTISGTAWVDKNKNGVKDENEAIENVVVKIIDLNNQNTFLKDENGKEIEAKTGKNGEYKIENVEKGKYNVIFKYDTSLYELNESLDIKDYIIESIKEKVAITKDINLEEDKTIDLQLIELTEFNLRIDKYISKVIVQNVKGTKTSEYVKQQLVREEIQSKYLSGSTVLVEYTIEVSNIGELEGYATEIVDYLPNNMKFYSELNTQWYVGEDGNIYNTSLASTKIQPGESKTVKLVLLKTMSKDNTGTTSNIVEISDSMNIKEYTDADLNNNQSKAEIIINPATGTVIAYIIAIMNSMIIVLAGMYIIKKKVIK